MSVVTGRSWKFWCLYVTTVAIVVVSLVEATAGVVMRRRLATQLTVFDCILCDEQNVLTVRPGVRQVWDGRPAFRVDVRTNARGFREDIDFADADVDVAFMGDSFAFGWGINVEKRVSNVVATALPRARVVSLSYNNGFQPEHYEYFLDRHPALRPKVVVVMLYLGNDLDIDLRETEVERGVDGRIVVLRLPYRSLYFGAMRNAAAYRPAVLGWLVERTSVGKMLGVRINQSAAMRARFTDPVAAMPVTNTIALELGELDTRSDRAFVALTRIQDRLRRDGGALHVAVIPQDFRLGAPPSDVVRNAYGDRVAEIVTSHRLMDAVLDRCVRDGLLCHDLSPALAAADHLPLDGHWTPSGHAKVGAFLRPVVDKALAASGLR